MMEDDAAHHLLGFAGGNGKIVPYQARIQPGKLAEI